MEEIPPCVDIIPCVIILFSSPLSCSPPDDPSSEPSSEPEPSPEPDASEPEPDDPLEAARTTRAEFRAELLILGDDRPGDPFFAPPAALDVLFVGDDVVAGSF